MEALVTDTHDRAALAGLRGLGRAGVRTAALAPSRGAAGIWSRYAAIRELGPDSIADPSGFAVAVEQILERHGERIVYPGREEAIDALLGSSRAPRARTLLPYPSLDALAAIRDKRRLPALAERAGLSSPRTLFEGSRDDLAADRVLLPCVVKAALPSSSLKQPRAIRSRPELEALLEELPGDEPLLAQELLRGELGAIAIVLDRDGGVAARFQQLALRTWPAEIGVSAVARSVAADEELIERVAGMLAAVGYAGLAHVQLLDRGAQRPVVIDVNPRFYGSMPLALAAGANLAGAWHAVVCGEATGRPPPYRVGAVYRWLQAELLLRLRERRLSWPREAGSPRAGATWARDDPLASAAFLAATLGAAIRKRLPVSRAHR